MRAAWIAVVVAVVAGPAAGDPKKRKHVASKPPTNTKAMPGKGFWKILVQPNKKWLIKDTDTFGTTSHPDVIAVEPVEIHKVGDATVAHLHWTLNPDPDSKDQDHHALAGTHAGLLNQVAVTDAGLYLLPDDADDAKIAEVLKGKPSRSDPPKPYKATKLNEGRYLTIEGDIVCMGQGPEPGEAACEDTCQGEVCISATDGVVSLEGTWAPNWTRFAQDAYIATRAGAK